MSNENNTPNTELMTLRQFLEQMPAGEIRIVTADASYKAGRGYKFSMPEVLLFCDSEICQGDRLHKVHSNYVEIPSGSLHFSPYYCKNCGQQKKTFALLFKEYLNQSNEIPTELQVLKIGEYPLFGHRVPPRTLRLIQPDAEMFKKGMRAESLGFGIGAFAYYRQIVERQREHLLKEIKKVALRLNTPSEFLKEYDDAIAENQFAKSIDRIKHGIPPSLLIDGHSPLLLLHNALSEGLHAGTDEEYLEIAASIRVVLMELANRISEALKDEKELSQAVSRLMQKKSSP